MWGEEIERMQGNHVKVFLKSIISYLLFSFASSHYPFFLIISIGSIFFILCFSLQQPLYLFFFLSLLSLFSFLSLPHFLFPQTVRVGSVCACEGARLASNSLCFQVIANGVSASVLLMNSRFQTLFLGV